MSNAERTPILSVRDLVIKFSLRGKELTPIRGISLDLYKGECLAIVGESGSGKSVLTKSFLGMTDKNGRIESGSILFDGEDIAQYRTEKQWLNIRGKKIAMVFQDPMTSLNPLKPVGKQIAEVMVLHKQYTWEEAKRESITLLERVGIPDAAKRYSQYPHEFSGGMRQRVVIAIGVACGPEILICDEPTTALDVTIQAQILQLVRDIQKEMNITVVYITHDLGVVANVADRVAVMYAGEIVEYGLSEEVFLDPRHPYTWALLSSLPQLGVKGEPLFSIEGVPPNLYEDIQGDAFAPRNPRALKVDFVHAPPYLRVTDTHYAKTWLLDPRAPALDAPSAIQRMRAQEW
jgi:oligopeptide transport system ATP-binding protein